MLLPGGGSYEHTHTLKMCNKIGPMWGSARHLGQKIITKCPPEDPYNISRINSGTFTHTHTPTHTQHAPTRIQSSTHAQDCLLIIEHLGPLVFIKFRYDPENVLFYWRVTRPR